VLLLAYIISVKKKLLLVSLQSKLSLFFLPLLSLLLLILGERDGGSEREQVNKEQR